MNQIAALTKINKNYNRVLKAWFKKIRDNQTLVICNSFCSGIIISTIRATWNLINVSLISWKIGHHNICKLSLDKCCPTTQVSCE